MRTTASETLDCSRRTNGRREHTRHDPSAKRCAAHPIVPAFTEAIALVAILFADPAQDVGPFLSETFEFVHVEHDGSCPHSAWIVGLCDSLLAANTEKRISIDLVEAVLDAADQIDDRKVHLASALARLLNGRGEPAQCIARIVLNSAQPAVMAEQIAKLAREVREQ